MFKAVIFDLNGTIIDDMQYHKAAWKKVLSSHFQKHFDDNIMKKELYGSNAEILSRIIDVPVSKEQMELISSEKEAIYQTEYIKRIELITGLPDFLNFLQKNSIPKGIATATIQQNADLILNGLEIRHHFDAIVTAEDVINSKPDPELFQKTAESLNTNFAECLVVEDSPMGVMAAQNAGMKAIAITTSYLITDFQQFKNVLFTISDFTDSRLFTLFNEF